MLKKLSALLVLMLAMKSTAFAAPCNPDDDDNETGAVAECVLLMSLGPIGTSIIASTNMNNDNRQVYLNQVRDDAADYIGTNGTDESAVLKEAINAIRSNAKYSGQSDIQIALDLVSQK